MIYVYIIKINMSTWIRITSSLPWYSSINLIIHGLDLMLWIEFSCENVYDGNGNKKKQRWRVDFTHIIPHDNVTNSQARIQIQILLQCSFSKMRMRDATLIAIQCVCTRVCVCVRFMSLQFLKINHWTTLNMHLAYRT